MGARSALECGRFSCRLERRAHADAKAVPEGTRSPKARCARGEGCGGFVREAPWSAVALAAALGAGAMPLERRYLKVHAVRRLASLAGDFSACGPWIYLYTSCIMNTIDWHHAPLHRFVPGSIYMITAGTLHKEHLFRCGKRLDLLQDTLLEHLKVSEWVPHAWACFSNHYHLVAKASESIHPGEFIKGLHQRLGYELNRMDGITGRTVMYQYWDKLLSFDNSYYPRLRYVMNNPVHHGLVEDARLYRWCSASWFHQNHSGSFRRRVESYGMERLNVPDAIEVE
jgi:putative transposase